jgi:hypothetical protein
MISLKQKYEKYNRIKAKKDFQEGCEGLNPGG